MITETVLQGTPRERVGKNASRQLRASGQIPVTLYGGGKDPIAVGINAREFGAILRSESGRNTIFTLDVPGGESTPVIVKQLDLHPVTGRVMHIDFVRINLTETTRVNVPLNFVGEPVGVKFGGGMLDVNNHTVEVECLPRDIPESIDADVSGLDLGEHFRAGDLKLDEDTVKLVSDPDMLIASVLGKGGTVSEAPESGEGETATE